MRASSLVLCVAALCAASSDSHGQSSTPGTAGRPAPSAKASASATPAKVVIPPRPESEKPPAFDAEPFPEDKSKAPTDEEWKSATKVRPSRVSSTVSGCRVWRVREWVKLHCDMKTAGLRLLAGSTEGVTLTVPDSLISAKAFEEKPWELASAHFETLGRFGDIVFPVRRGDRRVFEWMRLDVWDNYEGPPSVGSTSAMIVEEQWLEGAQPELSVLAR